MEIWNIQIYTNFFSFWKIVKSQPRIMQIKFKKKIVDTLLKLTE